VREDPPDVLLLDLDLPDVGGAEILRRLKADPATAPIPVIVISADTRKEQQERLMAAGARAYLTKPVEISRLMELAFEAESPGA
jgi:CheY-like chemotaxis protein